jgi:glyoxalase superfamily protein
VTSRFTELVVDCRDPSALAQFWAAALDYHVVRVDEGQVEIAPRTDEPDDLATRTIRGPVVPTVVFVAVGEGKAVKNRLHLDVRPVDRPYDAELRRLIDLGARPADVGQGSVPWRVLADPEGNEFCLLGPLDEGAI